MGTQCNLFQLSKSETLLAPVRSPAELLSKCDSSPHAASDIPTKFILLFGREEDKLSEAIKQALVSTLSTGPSTLLTLQLARDVC